MILDTINPNNNAQRLEAPFPGFNTEVSELGGTGSLPKLTCDLESSICGELPPSPNSDVKSGPDVEDSVALEVSAWSWERDEKEGVGDGSPVTPSPASALSLSLDLLETSWLRSGLCTEVLTRLF